MKPFALWMLSLGSLNMALAVALGAFGAHALRARADTLPLERGLEIWQTAVQYHLVHGLGLIAIGLAAQWLDHGSLRWAGWLLALGILLFSGSLYVMTVTGWRLLGPITPLGGVCFIIGWLLMLVAVMRHAS